MCFHKYALSLRLRVILDSHESALRLSNKRMSASFSQSINFRSSHVSKFAFDMTSFILAETYYTKRLLSDKFKPFVVEISTEISDK
jgi:hypothetical protein